MEWKIKKFSELTLDELYALLKVRAEVFVVEQNCVYQDLDSKDKTAYHLFLEDHHEIVACLRILPRGISYEEASIGRVLTKGTHRQKGLSKIMMRKALDFLEETMGETSVRISGQAYLKNFYTSFGFKVVSDIYLEDGIDHLEMLYRKDN